MPVIPAMALPLKDRARVFWRDWKIRMPAYGPVVGAVRLNVPLPLRVMPPKLPPGVGIVAAGVVDEHARSR